MPIEPAFGDELAALPLPIRVTVIDTERLPDEIAAARPDGGHYGGIWLLVRAGGAPRRLLKLAFEDGRITRARLEGEIAGLAPAPAAGVVAPAAGPAPLVSVVVCTMLGREQDLRDCLESLAGLHYPNVEILVVDNRPAGAAPAGDWIERPPRVRLVREPHPGASAARNRGLAEAAGEIVAFTDDDVVVDPGWLDAFAARLRTHPDEACATGLVLPRDLETEAQAELERFYGGFGQRRLDPVSHRLARSAGALAAPRVEAIDDDGAVSSTFLLYDFGKFGAGASMAFRTAALRAVGGFDVRLGPGTPTHAGEELCLFAKLAWRGERIAFVPSALAFHSHRRDLASLRRQVHCYGVGYTAAIVALALTDPRLTLVTAAALPRSTLALARAQARKLRRPAGGEPRARSSPASSLARIELMGMAQGPAALARSALATRRRRRHGRGDG